MGAQRRQRERAQRAAREQEIADLRERVREGHIVADSLRAKVKQIGARLHNIVFPQAQWPESDIDSFWEDSAASDYEDTQFSLEQLDGHTAEALRGVLADMRNIYSPQSGPACTPVTASSSCTRSSVGSVPEQQDPCEGFERSVSPLSPPSLVRVVKPIKQLGVSIGVPRVALNEPDREGALRLQESLARAAVRHAADKELAVAFAAMLAEVMVRFEDRRQFPVEACHVAVQVPGTDAAKPHEDAGPLLNQLCTARPSEALIRNEQSAQLWKSYKVGTASLVAAERAAWDRQLRYFRRRQDTRGMVTQQCEAGRARLLDAELKAWARHVGYFYDRKTSLECTARQRERAQRKGSEERLTVYGMWWTADQFRCWYGRLGDEWADSKARGQRWTERDAQGDPGAPSAPSDQSAVSSTCSTDGTPAAGESRIPSHEALLIDNVCFWLAAFVPKSWAPTCSVAARAVCGTTRIYCLGWYRLATQLGRFQSCGGDNRSDLTRFGSGVGLLYYGLWEVKSLRQKVMQTPFRGDTAWHNRWLLQIEMIINMYEELRLKHRELYLDAHDGHYKNAHFAQKGLAQVLEQFDQRTAA